MILFSALFINNGKIHQITFKAPDIDAAANLAAALGCGLEGEATTSQATPPPSLLPEAVDEKNARHMLGGISRTTLYRFLVRGKLERVAGTRKVLVTRRSIERFCA
ncbi:helix-turn-helix domain-containing protein [Nibricoccus aquaticus]|uniref:helix-turn-helix domain-containing protein n=1 Tax=Nibricoccus aquaticus TaxID=2576891 RepID=UPI0010FDC501|nr:helix-turn-helix domain-containing protein [Nibricoccus aquaticus]